MNGHFGRLKYKNSKFGRTPDVLIACSQATYLDDIMMQNNASTAPAPAPALSFRDANKDDAAFIAALVNSAYRGDSSRQGWTTEADLLQGQRISAGEVEKIIATEGSVVFLCLQQQTIIGCVQLEKNADAAYLGMFVVRPDLQGGGIGKTFMQAAEAHAQQMWGVKKIWMTVISVREELLAYYQRRGYLRTGRTKPFPFANDKEIALIANLQFEELEKIL